MTPVRFTSLSDIAILLAGLWLAYYVTSRAFRRSNSVTTRLRGPPANSYIWGSDRLMSQDNSVEHEEWRETYGPVYRVASTLGKERIMLMDPKAVAHFYARLGYGYVQNDLSRMFIERLFGRGLLWAEGDSHKRLDFHTAHWNRDTYCDLLYVGNVKRCLLLSTMQPSAG